MADDQTNRNAIRLLREQWRTPSAFAQELYMIESTNSPTPQPEHVASRMERMAQNVPDSTLQRSLSSSGQSIARQPVPSLGDRVRDRQRAVSQAPYPLPAQPGGGDVLSAGLPSSNIMQPGQSQRPVLIPAMAGPASQQIPDARASIPLAATPASSQPGIAARSSAPSYAPPKREEPLPAFQTISQAVSPGAVDYQSVQPTHFMAISTHAETGVMAGGERMADRRRFPSLTPSLPVPVHVTYDAATPLSTAYAPIGLPGAYSGQEREAGNYIPQDTPNIERDPGDPFAKKYYELRFPVTDWDSPRPTAGGGSNVVMGKVTASSPGTSDGPQTATVTLFPDGSAGQAGGSVQVNVPFLAAKENIPPGTWLVCIQSGSTYDAQPPIWLD